MTPLGGERHRGRGEYNDSALEHASVTHGGLWENRVYLTVTRNRGQELLFTPAREKGNVSTYLPEQQDCLCSRVHSNPFWES